ncbi:RNA polymerase sigma factor [Actinoplanes philippinensis]|uniref:RNA polymerase sigma factor n=1 Tax=Actinoplanes philippinensis TaxID=35752 RepID=A0A1I2NA01_9ACTN|nr:RNA polymerase sigma factor [Actinoplanes philippinensis]GIE83467.1 RNA polymerase sigma factor [Actinoplanes philippinensis]SFF99709.1 RNA polymerase sigma-70 factor, ECF subfamily [Actinoplanes philippinensis]
MDPGGDEALLRSIAAGDAAALSRLYERHAGPLFGYLFRLAGDRMTAEEILQDTMLAVWRSAGAFEGRAKVSTWLFGVARRQAHNRLRGRFGPEPTVAEPADRPDQGAGPEELAIAAAGGTPVAAAIDRLPGHHRDVIALVFVAGLPLADVAEVLAIPVGTVKSRLHHARAAVAAALTAAEVPE